MALPMPIVLAAPSRAVDPLSELASTLTGTLIRPTDAAYDDARRVWLASADRHPAAIVRAADAADVSRTVVFARETGMRLAVRSGGHSVAGYGTVDDGIVLDLRAMRALHIDPEARLAWAQPGLTAMEFTQAAAAHGLATGFGDTGTVGIAGLTLGGGIGYLSRKLGLTIDSLLAVELVLADGRTVTANESSHSDLFWAVRGGGGNVGIATRFQYRLHPVGTVLGGALVLPATRDVLRGIGEVAAAAPDELTTITNVMAAPPLPFLAPEHHGSLVAFVTLVYAGDPAEGERVVAPLRALATPLADLLGAMPYPGIYQLFEDVGEPQHAVHRSFFLDAFDEAAIDLTLDRMAQAGHDLMAMVQVRVLGGAISRVPADATAFAHRDAPVMLLFAAMYPDPSDRARHLAWVERSHDRFRARSRGAYVNFLEDEGAARVHEAYPDGTWHRLADVKRRYDPTNLFRVNQNVPPATAAPRPS